MEIVPNCKLPIFTRSAAVTFDIRIEDGSEFSFNFPWSGLIDLGGHGIPQRLVGRLV